MWAQAQLSTLDKPAIVRDARDFALLRGAVFGYKNLPNANSVSHIPFTLFPSPFPRSMYETCLAIQPSVNELLLKIALDHTFTHQTLDNVVRVDDFTRELVNLNKTILGEGQAQPIMSCISRSDYMIDHFHDSTGKSGLRCRQIEVNAISSGMSAHSDTISKMHQYLADKYRLNLPAASQVPKNESFEVVANGIIDAYDAYNKNDSYILFVVRHQELNFSEHHLIEQRVHNLRPDVKIVRKCFDDLLAVAKLGPNKELLVDGVKEIALVYFRCGYDPNQYNFQAAWDTRLLLERSRAIKCPSISFHLSGAKKFQQALNSAEQLERFLEPGVARKMSQTFCKIYSLDSHSDDGRLGFDMGINNSANLVLKPQREGGGHNTFGEDISPFLKSLGSSEDRSQYILMEYINSPCEKNWLLKNTDSEEQDVIRLEKSERLVSELGIFGSILANGNQVLSNRSGGYLVRSKPKGTNEGGVGSGYAGVSSLLLFDETDQSKLDILFDA